MVEELGKRPRVSVRLWRWRRSPLRRPCDVVEAWVLLAAWLLAVVGGVIVGLVTAGEADRAFEQQGALRREVPAVLVEGAAGARPASVVDDGRVWVSVRWTAPDGSKRVGRTTVAPDTPAGARVSVWTDSRGALTSPPLSPGNRLLEAALLGALATAVTDGAVWACAHVVRERLNRRRMDQWAEEWERIDTQWRPKTG